MSITTTLLLAGAACDGASESAPGPVASSTASASSASSSSAGGTATVTVSSASAGGGQGGGHAGGGGAGGAAGDPCLGAAPACPTDPSRSEGSGLVPLDRCAFPVEEQGFDGAASSGLAAALAPVTIGEVLSDLNRSATTETSVPGNPSGVTQAFGWNSGDQNVAYWIPQGITGSADAHAAGLVDGREVVLASWYYDADKDGASTGEKGVRVSLADVTNPAAVAYRHLLLVEPTMRGGQPDFEPVVIHAGGMAWVDTHLYVADTVHGFRVFDMGGILQVATGSSFIGYDSTDQLHYAGNYKYVIPQIGNYERAGSCTPRFSFVALDRSTTPPELVSGEYDSGSLFGRLFHWPLMQGDRLAPATSFPSRGYFALHSHLQGAVSFGAKHWLSSSEPPAGGGDLYVAAEGAATQTVTWVDFPEDLMFDGPRNKLWSLSEGDAERFVFAVSPPP